ncbi:YopX family protein [Lactiplantibacillus plantarum]|uniref:YopX family protein n=1 Tax=Lactiplantibacillus plantarum TaxID=1590 RepID=UPI0027428732|nr:YopX family protein [Lactiplantibacillus plantarum]MDP5372494.1 YopX family protein [Lactiplantibacillus plantarum]
MIKFRAWNGYRKMMADYVSAIQNGDTQGTSSSVNVIVNGKNETWDIKNDHVELLQFTGLKDVNGKDIYEGDILENRKYRSIVKFASGKFLADLIETIQTFDLIGETHGSKVIGNVHENPELLEESK